MNKTLDNLAWHKQVKRMFTPLSAQEIIDTVLRAYILESTTCSREVEVRSSDQGGWKVVPVWDKGITLYQSSNLADVADFINFHNLGKDDKNVASATDDANLK